MDRATLKQILGEIDPQAKESVDAHERFLDTYHSKHLSRIESNLKEFISSLIEKHIEKLSDAIEKHGRSLKEINDSHGDLSRSFSLFRDYHEKSRKKDRQELSGMLKEEIESQKTERDEKLKELAISLKRVGFGGGSMPLIPQIEIPTGTVDGTNTVFTAKRKPLWCDVSGQILVSSADDANNNGYVLSGTGPWTINFTTAPAPGQIPHSYYV